MSERGRTVHRLRAERLISDAEWRHFEPYSCE